MDLSFYNNIKPWPNERLDKAVIIGHTTMESAKIWARVRTAGHYVLILSLKEFSLSAEEPFQLNNLSIISTESSQKREINFHSCFEQEFSSETDLTGVFEVINLSPDTKYYYLVVKKENNRYIIEINENAFFRTLPGSCSEISFGLYSCHMPYTKNENEIEIILGAWQIFKEILDQENARFILGLGDQVYVDESNDKLNIWNWLKKVKEFNPDTEDMVSWYRDIYKGFWGIEQLKKVFSHYPMYMIWDDHEIKDGWGSYTTEELAAEINNPGEKVNFEKNLFLVNQMFNASKRVYKEYEQCHNPPSYGTAFDYSFANAAGNFYVLDTRGDRDFNRSSNVILGVEQLNRFKKWLEENSSRKGEARPLFIVSAIPLVHMIGFALTMDKWLPLMGLKDDIRDHWLHDNNVAELSELVTEIFKCSDISGRPVLILSGDVHIGTFYEFFSKDKYPAARVYQITSSAITYARLTTLESLCLTFPVEKNGEIGNTGIGYNNLFIYKDNNFAIIKVIMNGTILQKVIIKLFGTDKQNNAVLIREFELFTG
jgi:alkaline phosphatase D